MIIGIDASRANRGHKSGTEWYSYYLIRWLAKLDNKNQYILYTDKPLTGGLLDLSTEQYFLHFDNKVGDIKFDKEGYQIIKSPYNNFKAKVLKWPFSFFWTLGRFSLEMLISKKPDVLFVPAHTLPLFYTKKSIITIHDVAFEKNKCLYNQEIMGPEDRRLKKIICFFVKLFTSGKYNASFIDYLKWSTRFALKYSDRIITVSNFSKNEMLNIYDKCDKDKIKVIYNGYNSFLYRKINDQDKINEVLEKYGIEKPYILYVGRLEKKKNTPFLIEAFAMARENNKIKEKLVLIGDASFGYDEVKYVIREFNIASDVIMPGWVEEEDMPYIYNGSSAFIFPSKYEGFGIPVLQAMACQVPITISSIPVFKEVAGEAALFFNPNDVCSIAKAIEKILLDSNLKNTLILKGNERIKNFSWKKSAEETLKELNSI